MVLTAQKSQQHAGEQLSQQHDRNWPLPLSLQAARPMRRGGALSPRAQAHTAELLCRAWEFRLRRRPALGTDPSVPRVKIQVAFLSQ